MEFGNLATPDARRAHRRELEELGAEKGLAAAVAQYRSAKCNRKAHSNRKDGCTSAASCLCECHDASVDA